MQKSQQLHTTEKNKSSNSNQKILKHPQKTSIFEKIKKPTQQTQNHWFIAPFEIKTFKNKTAHDNDRKKYQKTPNQQCRLIHVIFNDEKHKNTLTTKKLATNKPPLAESPC